VTADLRAERRRNLVVAFAAGAMVLCASLANFLNYNEYPMLRPEVGLITAAFLCTAAVMALFYSAQRQWGRAFLEGALAMIFVDLNTDSIVIACVVGAAVALFSWWRRMSLLPALAVIGALVIATKALGIGPAPTWLKTQGAERPRPGAAPANQPAIVHIILDEHLGIEGLRNEGAEGEKLGRELEAFYLKNGFAIYGGAYSEHLHTVNAIPAILNYGRRLSGNASKKGVKIGQTEHLRALADQGYRLAIFQSDFADYCTGSEVDECTTYNSSSLRPTLSLPLNTNERAGLLALKFLALSDLIIGFSHSWNALTVRMRGQGWVLPLFDPENDSRSSTVGSMAAFDQLTRRLNTARPGTVYFAHLLLPHYPYVVGEDCSPLPWRSWKLRFRPRLEERRKAYYAQLRCTTRKLSDALRALARSPAGAASIVIIHGDHGSRITLADPTEANLGVYGDADIIAGFSTLFAVRAPGVEPAYRVERQPVAALLRESAERRFRSAPQPNPPLVHTVYLDDGNWKPIRRIRLPASWLDPTKSPKLAQRAASGVSD
jgi:hypothetical protein